MVDPVAVFGKFAPPLIAQFLTTAAFPARSDRSGCRSKLSRNGAASIDAPDFHTQIVFPWPFWVFSSIGLRIHSRIVARDPGRTLEMAPMARQGPGGEANYYRSPETKFSQPQVTYSGFSGSFMPTEGILVWVFLVLA